MVRSPCGDHQPADHGFTDSDSLALGEWITDRREDGLPKAGSENQLPHGLRSLTATEPDRVNRSGNVPAAATAKS